MQKTDLTEEIKLEIARRYASGELKKNIAKAMNLHPGTVGRLTAPTKVFRHSDEVKREIVRLVESGQSKDRVAKLLGVSRTSVSKYTEPAGPVVPPLPDDKKNELLRRALAGEMIANIARDLKIGKKRAGDIAAKVTSGFEPSKAQRANILGAREEGKTAPQIALEVKVPVSAVRKTLDMPLRRKTYPEEMHDAAIREMAAGKSAKEVAEAIGVSHPTAVSWFKKAISSGKAKKPEIIAKDDDHEFTWIARQDPELEEWRQLVVEWFNVVRNPGLAIKATSNFINHYLIKYDLPRRPADLLARGKLLPDFYEVVCAKSEQGRLQNKAIFELIEKVLDRPEFADTSVTPPIRLTHLYRNPISLDVHGGDGKGYSESPKPVLPYWMIYDLRKRIAQGPNFRDWIWVQGLLGRETVNGQVQARDWFPATEGRIDRNDPDCVWRLRQREHAPPVLEMWSPVRWVATLFHIQTPPRVGQVRMLDSGEADTFIWKDGQFIPNLCSLVQGTARNPRQQGIFRRPDSESLAAGAEVFLYFNTNKTADKGKKSNDKGFVCAWPRLHDIAEDPYYWLAKMRDWQMKYNPIERLTRWRDIKGSRKLSTKRGEQADDYPDTPFLFRVPECPDQIGPVSSDETDLAWNKLLATYQDILLEEGITYPNGSPVELINPINGRAWSSPHASRVSLITHLILDGNVPVEIMMKIVGHARFIMTIYYTKVGLKNIQDAIKQAAQILDAIKDQTMSRDLANLEAVQMRDRVVFNAEDWKTVLPVNPADRNPLGWLYMHDGICLAGGNTDNRALPGCHNGGPVLRKAGDLRRTYGTAPGGIRNCCRCRWKCAGKHHALGLQATLNNRQYHLHKASERAIEAERERNRLLQEKAQTESGGQPYLRSAELRGAERKYETAMQKMQEYAMDVAATHRMLERIVALPDKTSGPTALAAQGDLLTLQSVIEDTNSELLVLAEICADVEFFPDLDPGTAIFEFAQLLDRAFEREGQPLILARMSEKEKLTAANAIMRELERCANPDNPVLARRHVVEIMDRGESLEKTLGIKLKSVLQLADESGRRPVSLRLVEKDKESSDDDQRRAS
ncbi:MAG: hypothetical protein HY847_10110 [Betaproteobacteria bacterium]|nr:hypothetical protein [Betaproteobacteria bacterium]